MAGNKKNRTRKPKNKSPNGQQQPAQVARDKVVTRKRKNKSRITMTGMDGIRSNEKNFVRLALDPCNGPLTTSPFGATENSYIWRLNYRYTAVSNATGNLMACLYPLGLYNTGSGSSGLPQLVQYWNGVGFGDSSTGSSTAAHPMPGVTGLSGLAAQARVTAGCIKMQYIGPANVAQGELYAWEGQGDENLAAVNATQFMTASTPSSFCLNGKTFPITAGVESRLNYAKASTQQQAWIDMKVGQANVFCPIAVVGVSGGAATTNYVVEATIIVEWTPLTAQGIPAPDGTNLKAPGAAERVANALKQVAPILVSAGTMPLTGYAGAFSKAFKFGAAVYKAL